MYSGSRRDGGGWVPISHGVLMVDVDLSIHRSGDGLRGDWIQISHGELTVEILSRLPARIVARFRCVCRRWRSLTKEDSFIRSHTLRHPHPDAEGVVLKPLNSGFLQSRPFPGRPSPGLPDPSFSFLSTRVFAEGSRVGALRIKSTSNGLILFDTRSISSHPLPLYFVCNPTTKECRSIPHPPPECVQAIALFLDPSSPACRPLHYTVICIAAQCVPGQLPPKSQSQIWVYSSLTHSWRTSGNPFYLPFLVFKFVPKLSTAVSGGGAVHWADILEDNLVSFQVESEKLRVTPFPENGAKFRNLVRLGESRGRVHLMETYARRVVSHLLHIFELKDDFQWLLLYRVMLDVFPTTNPVTGYVTFPIAEPLWIFRRAEEEGEGRGRNDEALLLLRLEKKIISYNLHLNTHEKVSDIFCDQFNAPGWNNKDFEVAQYAHNLFSP